ncbi:MAG: hypothetical protein ACYS47_00285 [Planctomycetota bacterium]|jgi:peptidoglycan hydrolase CwlO-like protein
MTGMIVRLGLATLVAVATMTMIVIWGLQQVEEEEQNPRTVAVEVRDPSRDPWVRELRKRLEAEKKRQEEKKRALEEEAARVEKKRRALEEDLKKIRRTADDSDQDIKDREEAVDRLEAKLRGSQEEVDRRLEDVKTREAKAEADRRTIAKRQAELEALAETLLRQQKDLAARTQNIEKKESTLEVREAEARELAKVLIDRQKEIQDKQKALEESQKSLSNSQTDRDREWEKIRDEWKKIEDRRRALETKLSSAKTTAKDWEALKEEWQRLETERKKLEADQEVRENVVRFKKQFDRGAYERGLERVKRTVPVKGLSEGYVHFRFRFYTDQQALDHLTYFGIVDLYLNQKTGRYLVVENYRSGDFARRGDWDQAIQDEVTSKFSPFMIERKIEKRRAFFARAEKAIGAGVNIWGLIPLAMFYEIYYHKKRVLEAYSLRNDDLASFEIAPWHEKTSGRWMFKIIRVRRMDGTVIDIGNYGFS